MTLQHMPLRRNVPLAVTGSQAAERAMQNNYMMRSVKAAVPCSELAVGATQKIVTPQLPRLFVTHYHWFFAVRVALWATSRVWASARLVDTFSPLGAHSIPMTSDPCSC